MLCAGFADEVSVDIDQQIAAIHALGWPGIEMRLVGKGRHFDDVTDAEFETIREKLVRAGIQIVGYGSQIANWARKISGLFDVDVAELRQIMPRIAEDGNADRPHHELSQRRLGRTGLLWEDVVRRLRELARMAEANGITMIFGARPQERSCFELLQSNGYLLDNNCNHLQFEERSSSRANRHSVGGACKAK